VGRGVQGQVLQPAHRRGSAMWHGCHIRLRGTDATSNVTPVYMKQYESGPEGARKRPLQARRPNPRQTRVIETEQISGVSYEDLGDNGQVQEIDMDGFQKSRRTMHSQSHFIHEALAGWNLGTAEVHCRCCPIVDYNGKDSYSSV
jgi:hypothetical protein